jgi:hypothetical protein
MPPRRGVRRAAAAALLLASLPPLAGADPWVPSAGTGTTDFTLRQYDATQSFLPNQFGTATLPGSEQRYTMLRITGEHGLGGGLSIEYDLRAARVEKFRIHHGQSTSQSASGLEDQEVGLNLALTQRPDFADSITLNVVAAAGSASSTPALGVGHTAIEPDFQLGLGGRRWRLALKTGPRVFVDGGAAQMRAELDSSVRLSPRIDLGLILFYSRTVALRHPLPLTDSAERYDLLRPGVSLKYRINRHLKPFIEYEQYVAGQGIHAGRRITVGVQFAY